MQWNHFEIYKNSTETLHTDYLNKYPLWFERVDDPIRLTRLFQRYWQHTIGISIGYYLIIKIIQRQMYTSKPYELRRALIVWNACLALFSLCGLIRFTEDVMHSLVNYGLYKSICYSCHPGAATAYWSLLFAVSKFVELGDTLFIVLRKRPLIFLHYYHHAAVLIYTIHSGM
jgi:elongation of very long chain fatty acids protein 3